MLPQSNTSPLAGTAAALNSYYNEQDTISLDVLRNRLNSLLSRESLQHQMAESELRHSHERLRQKAAARLRDSITLQSTVELALEKKVEGLFPVMSKSKSDDDELDNASLYGTLMQRTDKALIEREATYNPLKKCVERVYEVWGKTIYSLLLLLIRKRDERDQRFEYRDINTSQIETHQDQSYQDQSYQDQSYQDYQSYQDQSENGT
jgi:hypothetical protein